jgi:hypothetical protein
MSLDLSKRPSPALVVAVCALAFAMVGTAVAGTGAVSKITKSKVKSIAKKQADQRLKANVAGSHVNVADTATNATNAGNAGSVDGQSVQRFFAKFPNGTANQVITTFGPYRIRADCTGGNIENLLVETTTQVDVAMLAESNGNVGTTFDEDNGGAVPNEVSVDQSGATDNDRGQGTFSVSQSNGTSYAGVIGYDDPSLFNGEAVCAVFGKVIAD